ncbi:hypothetical protein C8R45DRAFT_934435 [Mycena sanguinolenta]|nr:hypothetical protein C8R45DRAFT_934435 [Mycena sanguinolenta]
MYKDNRQVAQKPHKPHAAFVHCAKPPRKGHTWGPEPYTFWHNTCNSNVLEPPAFGDNSPAFPLLAHRNQTRLKMQMPGTEYEVKKPCAALRKCQKPHAAVRNLSNKTTLSATSPWFGS